MAIVHVTVRAWLSAFLFTQTVEIPVYVLVIRHALREGHVALRTFSLDGAASDPRPPRSAMLAPRARHLSLQLALAFGASAITHPVVWFVIPGLAPSFADPSAAYLEYVIRAEAFAFIVEAFYFHMILGVSIWRALGWSFLANGLSAGLGFLSRGIFGWP